MRPRDFGLPRGKIPTCVSFLMDLISKGGVGSYDTKRPGHARGRPGHLSRLGAPKRKCYRCASKLAHVFCYCSTFWFTYIPQITHPDERNALAFDNATEDRVD
ncbi:hypothetical protein ACN38_g4884 [Penicillium nordicum]|uniref:Uncharacterized protein n=1 Tax=Penicillium nordicum TaxID=229535 RepID=A0A0M9WGP6_9EURO|nr:hypothetical protein ACN38_g4884 [Penicillium nordicum]